MKTPLTSLMLQSDSIARLCQAHGIAHVPGERLERFFALNSRQLGALRRLIDDLFDVSRITTGHLTLHREPVVMQTLIQDVLERSRENLSAAACAVRFDCAQSVTANVDRTRIEQVLGNLINNAIKYARGAPLHITLRSVDEACVVAVHDAGPGIPPEKQPKVFQRFERATSKSSIGGLGLGLFIVAEIVRAHGGSIQLRSHPEPGCTFEFSLPLA